MKAALIEIESITWLKEAKHLDPRLPGENSLYSGPGLLRGHKLMPKETTYFIFCSFVIKLHQHLIGCF